jgi:hypothetical protein
MPGLRHCDCREALPDGYSCSLRLEQQRQNTMLAIRFTFRDLPDRRHGYASRPNVQLDLRCASS